jgi:hypothetical protein
MDSVLPVTAQAARPWLALPLPLRKTAAAAYQQWTTPDPSQREQASVPTPWHDGHRSFS